MKVSKISFVVIKGNKTIEFSVETDIDEHGSTVEAAVDNWTARTKDFTVESFKKYVKSKGHKCRVIKTKEDDDL